MDKDFAYMFSRNRTGGHPCPFLSIQVPKVSFPMKHVSDGIEGIFVSSEAPSFADVLDELKRSHHISTLRRRDLSSAVTRIAALLRPGRSLAEIPADPEWCRARLSSVRPRAAGLSEKTMSNLTSNLTAAFREAGITRKRFAVQLEGDWAVLWSRVLASGDKQLSCGLSRFPRFCQQIGLQPTGVAESTLDAYRVALEANELTRDPCKAVYYAARAWNRAVEKIAGWPPRSLVPPSRRNDYALPWSAFPERLECEIDAWLEREARDDIFDLEAREFVYASSTAALRKGSLQRLASSMVHAGTPATELTDLSALLVPERVRHALNWLMQKRDLASGSGGLFNIMIAVVLAAQHASRLSDEQRRTLATWKKRLAPRTKGMTAKNRQRMLNVRNPKVLRRVLAVPNLLVLEARVIEDPKRAATRIETAVAIGLLLSCPIRFANLCAIDLDANLVRIGHGRSATTYLRFAACEVKNRQELQFEIPPAVEELIARFMHHHRRTLLAVESRFLFSHRSKEAPVGQTSLRRRIGEAIRRLAGVDLSPHNFRHLAGQIMLMEFPGQYETVRRLLGHKSGSTALDHYIGLEIDMAHRAFTDLLTQLEGEGGG